MIAKTEARRYIDAMIAGNLDACIAIERRRGLDGYPPEVVSVGLQAFDEGRDPVAAAEAYINGGCA